MQEMINACLIMQYGISFFYKGILFMTHKLAFLLDLLYEYNYG